MKNAWTVRNERKNLYTNLYCSQARNTIQVFNKRYLYFFASTGAYKIDFIPGRDISPDGDIKDLPWVKNHVIGEVEDHERDWIDEVIFLTFHGPYCVFGFKNKTYLAKVALDGTAKWVELPLPFPSTRGNSVVFESERRMFFAGQLNFICVVNIQDTPDPLGCTFEKLGTKMGSFGNHLSISPDGKFVVCATDDSGAMVYRIQRTEGTGEKMKILETPRLTCLNTEFQEKVVLEERDRLLKGKFDNAYSDFTDFSACSRYCLVTNTHGVKVLDMKTRSVRTFPICGNLFEKVGMAKFSPVQFLEEKVVFAYVTYHKTYTVDYKNILRVGRLPQFRLVIGEISATFEIKTRVVEMFDMFVPKSGVQMSFEFDPKDDPDANEKAKEEAFEKRMSREYELVCSKGLCFSHDGSQLFLSVGVDQRVWNPELGVYGRSLDKLVIYSLHPKLYSMWMYKYRGMLKKNRRYVDVKVVCHL